MVEGDAIAIAGQQALWTALLLGGPLLVVLLVVGMAFAVLQALTQIQEASFAFVPKLLALGVALMLGGPAGIAVLRSFSEMLFDRIAALGGAG
jgi:flagellar biosynthetic protein FliQ